MDLRPIICLCLWAFIAVVCSAAESEQNDKLSNLLEDPSSPSDLGTLESLYGYDDAASKRGTMFRFGRGSLFRFGKRPSTFRYGKRRTLFRFGKRDDESSYDADEVEKRKTLFRFGKRFDDAEAADKRGSLLRYGKRFARDTKRANKVHTPFRFGRELESSNF